MVLNSEDLNTPGVPFKQQPTLSWSHKIRQAVLISLLNQAAQNSTERKLTKQQTSKKVVDVGSPKQRLDACDHDF